MTDALQQPSVRPPVIAIDGPAGAGKSTLAAYLAARFGFINLETGAMYRALAWKALEKHVPLNDEAALARLVEDTQIVLEPHIEGSRVFLDGRDVTTRIREKDVTEAASQVSVHPRVRAWMVEHQRAMGEQGGVVMEGRDIGTKVFPDAEVKIFLDAAPQVRGQRRYMQDVSPSANREAILAAVMERDERDRGRSASPLEPAADAVILDSTGLSFEQVAERAEALVRAKLTHR